MMRTTVVFSVDVCLLARITGGRSWGVGSNVESCLGASAGVLSRSSCRTLLYLAV